MIEGDVALRQKVVPFGEGKRGVAGGKTGDKMVFPGLYRAFSGVSAMAVGWYALETDAVLEEGLFEVVGAFIVEDVERGSVAVRF
jgi:hypothetical protein